MKLIKTIVNENFKLIGFVVKGIATELGSFGNREIEKPIQLSELLKANFSNEQVEVRNGKLFERKGFTFNTLEMVMFKENNFIQIDNHIKLTKRVLVNGELKGFNILLGNTLECRYTYDNVIRISSWCKPDNFVIRVNENKAYIAGKGIKLQDLPEEELGHNVETSTRKRAQYGGQSKEKLSKDEELSNSLLELYSYIKSCDGVIIKLADEAYKSASVQSTITPDTFMPLGVCEIGSPYIDFSNSSLNANTLFKKVGTISGEVAGNVTQLYTFTWSAKSIFINGENYIKRFGIGVTKDVAEQIIQKFGKQLVTKMITDKRVITPIISLTGKKDYVFFEVDTTKLVIMNKDTAKDNYLSNKDINKLVRDLTGIKVNKKILKGYIKAIKESNPSIDLNKGKVLFGLYRGMSNEALKDIANLGIDVYSGAYIVKEKLEKSIKDEAVDKEKTSSKIEVEYSLLKVNLNKITYASIVEDIKANKKISEYCSDRTLGIISLDGQAGVDAAQQYLNEMEKAEDKIKYKLWLHRLAMYTLGDNKLYMNDADRASWVEKKTRAKVGKVYACEGCENLVLKVINIDI